MSSVILVLDLDDTLYDESTFVDSGFAAVAQFLSTTVDEPATELHARMQDLLAEHGRGRVFDLLLASAGIPASEAQTLVPQCVEVYRTHEPAIALSPEVSLLLDELSSRFPLYLVTDGDPDVQARKIAALRLTPYFRECFRTWAFGREAGKPSLTCFEMIRAREGGTWADLVYVGDDPSKDFVGLRGVGARTIRVLTGRFRDIVADEDHEADVAIPDITQLGSVL